LFGRFVTNLYTDMMFCHCAVK